VTTVDRRNGNLGPKKASPDASHMPGLSMAA
jgi:hypothetical protein